MNGLSASVIDDPEAQVKPTVFTDKHEFSDKMSTIHPFKRWVDNLRAKKSHRHHQPSRYVEGWSDACCDSHNPPHGGAAQEPQWESLSGHSSNLGTVKTSTLSIVSQSIVRSRGTTQSTTPEMRGSLESQRPTVRFSIDEEAQSRAVKRRRVLREIVSTEVDYVFGLQALTNVLFLFSERPQLYYCLHKIREIHEEFLACIRKVTPMSSVAAYDIDRLMPVICKRINPIDLGFKSRHHRSLKPRNVKAPIYSPLKALAAESAEALEVAHEIWKLSASFTIYTDFCSSYEQIIEDVDLLRRSVSDWPLLEQGIEALSKSVASIESQGLEQNKSMLLNDLLIKPIQRVCKYPLLLQELLRWTHIQDDPIAHDGIRQVLDSVRAMVQQINKAPGNPVTRLMVQKTLQLQEMLHLPNPGTVHHIYKQLGPLNLCGVLHVTYRASKYITGGYMVCVLFRSHFLLAKVNDDYRGLEAVACLYICDAKIDTLRNGQGLCCYGCYFSWKLVFQYRDHKFELVLSASSANEEKQWKTELLKSIAISADVERIVSSELRGYSFLTLELFPLGRASRCEPPLSRTTSVQSLKISRHTSDLQNVVIKRTHCPHTFSQTVHHVDGELERPKLSLPVSPIILTSPRQHRIRLEKLIYSVYTRECLPYPGMTLARGDILFRPGTIVRRFTVRPGLYRRSSSVNLPCDQAFVEDGNSKCKPTQSQEDTDASEKNRSVRCRVESKKGRDGSQPAKDDMGSLRRNKTSKLKDTPKLPYTPGSQFTSDGDGSFEHVGYPSLRTSIRAMFNSMSWGRTKRHPRLRLDSGGQ
ncbi:Dbl homology domain-containing protein [Aspergillus avenaceus]|uniref:Dbl homology domain-containing protein n=1 Tax=Aspergillus avenaceus TaxID=36643 RepID=A0A5N6TMB1_ASPAV|nr:Dbl homology domain-containing protein [Aspergillus avenaceus]